MKEKIIIVAEAADKSNAEKTTSPVMQTFLIQRLSELKMPFIDPHEEKNNCRKGWKK